MQIVALTSEHLLRVPLQAAQGSVQPFITPEMARDVVQSAGVGATALLAGEPIACAGIVELHPQRAQAWALFSSAALAHFKTIHRMVLAVIQAAPWRRIEMTVDCAHPQAVRWAGRLGFRREGIMRAYTPDARDHFLYARIKE